MAARYTPARPVCRTIDERLSDLADAVRAHLDEVGLRRVAVSLGVGKSTLADWGADLDRWKASALLRLARLVPTVGDALRALDQAREDFSVQVTLEAITSRSIADDAAGIAQRNEDLSDGSVNRGEARRRLAMLDREIAHKQEERRACQRLLRGAR